MHLYPNYTVTSFPPDCPDYVVWSVVLLVQLLYEYIPFNRESCMCHSLHLVVKDGLKSAGVLNKVISKASNIVSHIRRSTTASDLLEGESRVQAATST